MMTSKFLADAEIERRANRLLGRYEAQYEPISNPPIPVECILEDVLDLGILWDTIPEEPGQSILAGLDPNNKTVVFNESRLALIEETPGLYNTVLGHEAGHWEAHVDPALLDQTQGNRVLMIIFRIMLMLPDSIKRERATDHGRIASCIGTGSFR